MGWRRVDLLWDPWYLRAAGFIGPWRAGWAMSRYGGAAGYPGLTEPARGRQHNGRVITAFPEDYF